MTTERLHQIVAKQFDECEALLKQKNADYAPTHDAVGNFKEAAAELGSTPYQILGVYLRKHLCAISAFIRNNGQLESEPIEGRITDAINYLVFLRALIVDRKEEATRALPPFERIDD